jgi:hypothetical protein
MTQGNRTGHLCYIRYVPNKANTSNTALDHALEERVTAPRDSLAGAVAPNLVRWPTCP